MTPSVNSPSSALPRILVLGAHGQIGFELIRDLQGLGTIHVPDRSVFDLGDADSIRAAIHDVRPALIINAAAYTDVARAEQETEIAHQINAIAPGVIAEAAKACGSALIHYSTDYVFDGSKTEAYEEDDQVAPLNQYGMSKLAGEKAIVQASDAYMIFRTSWIYGARGRNFLSFVQREAALGKDMRIVADQIGAPTWSRTVAAMTTHVVRQGLNTAMTSKNFWSEHSGVYHLTSEGATSWHGFAQAIIELLPQERRPSVTAISSSEFVTPARRPANSVLNNGKFNSAFGISAPNWREALVWCMES